MLGNSNNTSIFRVDRFLVPAAARAEFLSEVEGVQAFLDPLDGCLQNLVLEKPAADGSSHVLTVVEWRDAEASEAAGAASQARQRARNLDVPALLARLGITAELGNYGVLG